MLACVRTAAVFGIEACPVHVEVDVSFGLPGFTMVGLPDATRPREPGSRPQRDPQLRLRVSRSTASPSTWRRPTSARRARRSICRSRSACSPPPGCVTRRDVDDVLLLGELSLDGGIQPARGVLPIAAAARRERFRGLLLPRPNRAEAAVVEGLASLSGALARRGGRAR